MSSVIFFSFCVIKFGSGSRFILLPHSVVSSGCYLDVGLLDQKVQFSIDQNKNIDHQYGTNLNWTEIDLLGAFVFHSCKFILFLRLLVEWLSL